MITNAENIKFPIYSGPLFGCCFCDTFFISCDFLEKHRRKCENFHIMRILKSNLNLKRKNREFHKTRSKKIFEKTCGKCLLNFHNFSDYKKHMMSHKRRRKNSDDVISQRINEYSHLKISQNSEMKFECTLCREIFDEKIDLIKHLKIHSELRPYVCLECEKDFKILGVLNRHYKTVHDKSPKYKCDECHMRFNTKAILITHGAAVHNHEKPFKCVQCEKSFCTHSGLENHKLIHSGLKPFQCEQCYKCFTQKGALHLHISSVHKKEKLFQCEICFKSFSQKANLKHHVIRHTGLKPYKCNECGKGYRQNSDLKKHILLIHKQE